MHKMLKAERECRRENRPPSKEVTNSLLFWEPLTAAATLPKPPTSQPTDTASQPAEAASHQSHSASQPTDTANKYSDAPLSSAMDWNIYFLQFIYIQCI